MSTLRTGVQFALALLVLGVIGGHASTSKAAQWHVESYGLDSNTCGSADPCRSISAAIQRASAGDVISVGPGIYGDLNQNGILGEPGEETGEIGFGCNCVVKVDKAVTIHSTQGAKVTRIDATSVSTGTNLTNGVHIMADNAVFGFRDKGFQITGASAYSVLVDTSYVKISGNVAIGDGNGYWADAPNNQLDWDVALVTGNGFLITEDNNTVTNSIASGGRDIGFTLSRGSVRSGPSGVVLTNDVSIGNQQGFNILGNATLTGISAVGNLIYGIALRTGSNVTVANSNIYANGTLAPACGIDNQSGLSTTITNSFWGAAAGPGTGSANGICNDDTSTTVVPSVAATPFRFRLDR